MAKYYVTSGAFKQIIDRPTPKKAAVDAFKTLENKPVKSLGTIVMVSESGFDSDNDDDFYFSTIEILEQSDQLGNYKSEDWLN
jgi:hypothetical protein